MSTDTEGLSAIKARKVTAATKNAAAMTVLGRADNADEAALFLAMLGLPTPKAKPSTAKAPDLRCTGPCGRSMYRRNWPQRWREGRILCNAIADICPTCRRNERVAAGEIPPPQRKRQIRKTGIAYRPKTG